MLKRCGFLRSMSKKLKFDNLSSPRRLRSSRKENNGDLSSKTSAYFVSTEETTAQKNEKKPAKRKAKREVLGNPETEGDTLEEGASTKLNKSSEGKRVNSEEVDVKVKSEPVNNDEDSSKNEPQGKDESEATETLKVKRERKKRTPVKIKCEEPNDSATYKDAGVKAENGKWMPANWEKTLEHIKEMRKHGTAPVDEMGCHKCADPNASDRVFRYQSLIALMLSSQTKDQVTHAATQRLNAYGCTPETILATPDEVLMKLIYPVGFYKRKVEYIKKATQILVNKYNGDIPRTIKGLCELPGVGPKMGHICMQIAWGEVSGIGVDTHVHRICNRLEWVRKQAKTPEETRMDLEDWLPKELWKEVNHLLVGFGQEICLPRFPKCGECLNRGICPYAIKNGIKEK